MRLVLRKNQDRRVRAGHPWVFSNEIREIVGERLPGVAAEIFDAGGGLLGTGYYNPRSHFGEDGHFVRAVQNGYNLVFHTHRYAPRFTRRLATDKNNACATCHTPDDLAYAFVNSDRVDAKLGKRISFEDRVRRCYAGAMDGFVPTIYDPAVRDIRLFARAVAHHLELSEGAIQRRD